MNPSIINARVTFHNSPIHILEKFTFKDARGALEQIKRGSGLDECVILQTCNRVEVFGCAQDCSIEKIKDTWAETAGLDRSDFDGNLEMATGHDAYHHLLRLTSGMDSMVIGEEQILGQVKQSITAAKEARASGQRLNTLFDKAIRMGTRIRNTTEISRGGTSVGSMAVKLAEENIDDLKSKRILLIGTGEVSTLVAKSLSHRGYRFDVTSRTIQRSQAFCEAMGGHAVKFEDVLAGFGRYDLLFVATTAPYFLVTYERIAGAMRSRDSGMMILDLSNPRTVDEKVATLAGTKLMNLDQIAEMVDKNMRRRIGKVRIVEGIINEEIEVLEASMKRLDIEPLVKEVFKNIDTVRQKELQKALQMLDETDSEKIKIIEDLTKAVVEGVISSPMNNLRRASEHGDGPVLDAASRLFNYQKTDPDCIR